MKDTIGDRIKRARKVAKLTQWALSQKAGLEPIAISRIERGKRKLSADEAPAMARALGVSLGWLQEGVG